MTFNGSIGLNDPYAPLVGPFRPSINVGAQSDAIPGYPLDFGIQLDGNGMSPHFAWNDNLTEVAHSTFGKERFEKGFKAFQEGLNKVNQPIRQLRKEFNYALENNLVTLLYNHFPWGSLF